MATDTIESKPIPMTLRQDLKKVRELREYFRATFVHGNSDEFFYAWIRETQKQLAQLTDEELRGLA